MNELVFARGELGEMHLSCPCIIRPYWNGRSEASFYSDATGRPWFTTGNADMIDKHGVVFVLGRVKDTIRRADVSIMPAPIESSIESFAGAQVGLARLKSLLCLLILLISASTLRQS